MSDLSVLFCELTLNNPVIASSALGISDRATAEGYADAGAAAVTLAPICDTGGGPRPAGEIGVDPEAADYSKEIGTRLSAERTTDLIAEIRQTVEVPVIASLRCSRRKWWVTFARQAAKAGAGALELDLSDIDRGADLRAEQWEKRALRAVDAVKSTVSIPVILKAPYSLTAFGEFVSAAKEAGARGVILSSDRRRLPIDSKRLERGDEMLFGESDRQGIQYWIAELYRRVGVDLAADLVGPGPESAAAILAGAHAVGYGDAAGGVDGLARAVEGVARWLESHTFSSVYDARGRLSRWEKEKLEDAKG